jgi:hypothetical protein
MSKMGLHDPFGHLKHNLWPKERPVWLPTTKSWESTQFPCVQVACDMMLERFWRGLQLRFRPHPDRSFAEEVIVPQSHGSSNLGDFGTPKWEFRDEKPFGWGRCKVVQSILYGGRWWVPPSRAVVNLVSSKSPVACPSTKGAPTMH